MNNSGNVSQPLRFQYDFLGKKAYAFVFTGLCIVFSIWIWFAQGTGKFGIDYTGGHEVVVRTSLAADEVRAKLESGGFQDVIVQSFERGTNEYSIRFASALTSNEIAKNMVSALSQDASHEASILKQDFVGPAIGEELKNKAYLAIAIGLIGMLIYISIRFEFAFALGAVAALFHDVVVAMGVYLLFGHQITVATLAAAMTIVGYSVNDTIVIFDRVREELFKQDKMSLEEVVNYSVNATLGRTIITNLLTFFSCLALYLVGGGAIADLSFFLLVGVLAGCYSTIYIASPVAIAWESWRRKRLAAQAAA